MPPDPGRARPSEETPPAAPPDQDPDAGPRATSRRQSSSDRIVRDIVQGLYEGRYVPGQRLVEADIALAYQVGRSSVREALSRLAAENIVDLSLHRGAQIRTLSGEELLDILEILEVTIGLAARKAAQRLGPEERKVLEAALENLLVHERRPESFDLLRARNHFYRALVQASGNLELQRLLPRLHVHLVRYQRQTHSDIGARERYAAYRRLGASIVSGDGAAAERAARAHVHNIIDTLASRAVFKLPAKHKNHDI